MNSETALDAINRALFPAHRNNEQGVTVSGVAHEQSWGPAV